MWFIETEHQPKWGQAGYTVVEVLCALVILSLILIPLYFSIDHYRSRLEKDTGHAIQVLDSLKGQMEKDAPTIDLPRSAIRESEPVHIEGESFERYRLVNIPIPMYVFNLE